MLRHVMSLCSATPVPLSGPRIVNLPGRVTAVQERGRGFARGLATRMHAHLSRLGRGLKHQWRRG
jgi:hypothetical protein